MPKGALTETKIVGEGSELRDLLSRCELSVGKRERSGTEALAVVQMLDRATELMEALRISGMDVRPEEGRYVSLQEQLRSKAGRFVREMRDVGGLKVARSRQDSIPPESHWWWYLDVLEEKRLKARLRKTLRYAAVGIVLVAAAVLSYEYLLPRDRVLEAKLGHVSAAEQHISMGEIDAAVAEYELAAEMDPTDAEVQIWLGVLYEQIGRSGDAETAFDKARSLMGDDAQFLATRGLQYVQVGAPDKALEDGQAATSIDPDLAQAHLVLASAYEAMGDYAMALQELEITGELASRAGNDTLYVIARTQQAMLMQRPPSAFSSEPTPTGE